MIRRFWTIAGIMFSATGLVGCGDQQQAIDAIQNAVRISQNGASAQIENDEFDSSTAVDQREFQPYNPDRVNPFTYIGDDASVSTGTTSPHASMASAKQVNVLGFANVGSPRVILRIGDQTKVLNVGDTLKNVRVIAIDPPRVELETGNLIWTATMFDDRH